MIRVKVGEWICLKDWMMDHEAKKEKIKKLAVDQTDEDGVIGICL